MRPSFPEDTAPVIVGEYATFVSNMQYVISAAVALSPRVRRSEGAHMAIVFMRAAARTRTTFAQTDT